MTGILEPSETDKLKREIRSINSLSTLTPELIELREIVFDSHFNIEEILESILIKDLFLTARGTIRRNYHASFATFKTKTQRYFSDLNFIGLTNMLFDHQLITHALKVNLKSINKSRVDFAHLKSGKYIQYEDEGLEKWLLETILSTTRELAKIEQSYKLTEY